MTNEEPHDDSSSVASAFPDLGNGSETTTGASEEETHAPVILDPAKRDAQVRADLIGLYARLHQGRLEAGDVLHTTDVDDIDLPWVVGSAEYLRRIYDQGTDLQPDVVVFGKLTMEDGTILDIGAHWGYSAVAMRQSGTNCEILSFEPMEFNWPSLAEFKMLDNGGYDYVMCALTDEPREIRLYSPAVNGRVFSGLNSADGVSFTEEQVEHVVSRLDIVIPPSDRYHVNLLETTVKAYRLDDMTLAEFTHIDLSKIAAMKIDVEGFEIHVLKGAERTIDRDRPFVMIEEGNRAAEVAAFFRDRNYCYAERDGQQVIPVSGTTDAVNGYWIPMERVLQYIEIGIVRLPDDLSILDRDWLDALTPPHTHESG